MARDISFLQYMRAHGNTPAPTQRPYLNGAISGLFAAVPSFIALYFSDALDSIERRLAKADAEEAMASEFDLVVVNADLEAAVEEVAAILEARRTS